MMGSMKWGHGERKHLFVIIILSVMITCFMEIPIDCAGESGGSDGDIQMNGDFSGGGQFG